MLYLIFVFLLAYIISLILTPFVRDTALRFNIVDHPEERKIHSKPIPVFGGIAIIISFYTCYLLLLLLGKISFADQWGLLFGGIVVIGIGAWDKIFGIQSHLKMGLLFATGILIVLLGHSAHISHLGLANFIFSILWIAGITNALNYLDNMDGLSAGIATTSALSFFFVALMTGQGNLAYIAIVLAGACLGFLKYNFKQASIFMGDIGSYFIGFVLAIIGLELFIPNLWLITLELKLAYLQAISYVIPILILGVPIFDTFLVTILRPLAKRSITQAGKDHTSHRLHLLGLSRQTTVIILIIVQSLLGLSALAILKANVEIFFLIIMLVTIFVATAWFFLAKIQVY